MNHCHIFSTERAAAAKDGTTGPASTVAQTSTNQAALNTTPFPSDAIFQKIQTIIDTDNAK